MRGIKNYLIVIVLFLFVGCGSTGSIVDSNKYSEKYNDNSFISGDSNLRNSKNTNLQFSSDGRTIDFSAGELNGIYFLSEAEIDEQFNNEIYISMKVNKGRGKLVLVKPNKDVEVIKEVISGKSESYEGNISFDCECGKSFLKMIGDGFGGELKIIQNNKIVFIEKNSENMFKDGLFGSRDNKLEM